jgi:hypothetical protein
MKTCLIIGNGPSLADIPNEFLEKYRARIAQLQKPKEDATEAHKDLIETLNEMLDGFVKTYKHDLSQLDRVIEGCGQSAVNFGTLDGALQVNEKYLDKCEKMLEETGDYLIVRQEYESGYHGGMKLKQEQTNQMYVAADRLQKSRNKLKTNAGKERREILVSEFRGNFNKYIEATTKVGMGTGISIENRNILMHYDHLLASNGETEVGNVQMEVIEPVQVQA